MKSGWKLLLLLFLISFGFVACEKDAGPVIKRPVVPVLDGDTFISFENDIQPIFNARCILCHNQFHPFLDLRDSVSYKQLLYDGFSIPYYVIVYDPSQSLLIQHLLGVNYSIMPPTPPPLSKDQIDIIIK